MGPELSGASLHIDLRALQRNYLRFCDAAGTGKSAATVKADAYGLGLVPVARALWAAGCRSFFVALPGEGVELRAALPDAEIIVLNGLLPGAAAFYAKAALTPALAQPEELAEWASFCRATSARQAAAIHFDTGINRLGFSERQLRAIKPDDLAAIHLTLVMSHLANADAPDDEMNARQLARFHELRQLLPPCRLSLANSPGSLLDKSFAQDLLRPGIGLYGGNPYGADQENPFEPVVRLTAPVMQVREVMAGEKVGYTGSFTAKRPSRIAIFGAGYRDGYPRALSSGPEGGPARVFIAGHFAPIAGRVSMDMISVDVTDIPAEKIARGTVAEVLGEHVTLDEMASLAGTIPYEILTRLGTRYARIYSGFESPDQGAPV